MMQISEETVAHLRKLIGEFDRFAAMKRDDGAELSEGKRVVVERMQLGVAYSIVGVLEGVFDINSV